MANLTKIHYVKIFRRLIRASGPYIPFYIYKRFYIPDVTAFVYHVISDSHLPHIKHLYSYKTPDMFELDLLYLKHNYTLVSYQDLANHYSGKFSLPPSSAFVSFDDGYSECYTTVRPLLLKHRIPCTFFLTTDFINNNCIFYRNKVSLCIDKIRGLSHHQKEDVLQQIGQASQQTVKTPTEFVQWITSLNFSNEREIDIACNFLEINVEHFIRTHKPYLTTDQIRVLQSDGFAIGAHTQRHAHIKLLSEAEQLAEIVKSCKIIQDLTKVESVPFAFPYTSDGIVYSHIIKQIAKYPFIGLLFDANGLRKRIEFAIDRIWVDKPLPGIDPAQNIPLHLKNAYVKHFEKSIG